MRHVTRQVASSDDRIAAPRTRIRGGDACRAQALGASPAGHARLAVILAVDADAVLGRLRAVASGTNVAVGAIFWPDLGRIARDLARRAAAEASRPDLRDFSRLLEEEYHMRAYTDEVWIVSASTAPLWPGGWNLADTHLKGRIYYRQDVAEDADIDGVRVDGQSVLGPDRPASATSSRSPRTRVRRSTIVTSIPRAEKTDAYSMPITPPPTTVMERGSRSSGSKPSLVMTRSFAPPEGGAGAHRDEDVGRAHGEARVPFDEDGVRIEEGALAPEHVIASLLGQRIRTVPGYSDRPGTAAAAVDHRMIGPASSPRGLIGGSTSRGASPSSSRPRLSRQTSRGGTAPARRRRRGTGARAATS
jgi:hypothetical protein